MIDLLRKNLSGVVILGPGEPMISKIRNQYLMTILIKIPRAQPIDLPQLKKEIEETVSAIYRVAEHRKSRIILDVDPV